MRKSKWQEKEKSDNYPSLDEMEESMQSSFDILNQFGQFVAPDDENFTKALDALTTYFNERRRVREDPELYITLEGDPSVGIQHQQITISGLGYGAEDPSIRDHRSALAHILANTIAEYGDDRVSAIRWEDECGECSHLKPGHHAACPQAHDPRDLED